MKELKEQLFKNCAEEAAIYSILPDGDITTDDPVEAMEKDYEKEAVLQRFLALHGLIAETGLLHEYEEYTEDHPHVIRYCTPSQKYDDMSYIMCICPQTESFFEYLDKSEKTIGMETVNYEHYISIVRSFRAWNLDEGLAQGI